MIQRCIGISSYKVELRVYAPKIKTLKNYKDLKTEIKSYTYTLSFFCTNTTDLSFH